MELISNFLSPDHKRCDELFAAAEGAVAEGRWQEAEGMHQEFLGAMERHFAMEERLLFPAFEKATGMLFGPTEVMRHEHGQMRQLFAAMDESLSSQARDDYLGLTETLLILMQQHNSKEEQILYRMSDRALGDEAPQLVSRMRELAEA